MLAPKLHQEGIIDIEDVLRRMCLSYHGLNKVTNPFECPICRCDSVIVDLGDASGTLYFICLDKVQGYHQIGVKTSDKDKLAFFIPDGLKYTFKVMSFGPINAPRFSTMIRNFQDEWTLLFRLECNKQIIDYDSNVTGHPARTNDFEKSCTDAVLPNLDHDNEYVLHPRDILLSSESTHTIPITGGDIVVRQKMASSNIYHITCTQTIIDDIVGWSTSKSLMILILKCVC